MADKIFREKSLKYISSPEQLNDYLKVTKPSVWVVLFSIVLLLIGLIVWGTFAYIASSVDGVAEVENGMMTVYFHDDEFAVNVQEGMEIIIGDTEIPITSVGRNSEGHTFAVAETDLEDGHYDATVNYKQTQVLGLLIGYEGQ